MTLPHLGLVLMFLAVVGFIWCLCAATADHPKDWLAQDDPEARERQIFDAVHHLPARGRLKDQDRRRI